MAVNQKYHPEEREGMPVGIYCWQKSKNYFGAAVEVL